MPVVSRFFGIIIKMYYQQNEHNPPHIHAIYGDYMGAICIRSGRMIEGDLPARALSMVQEWLGIYRTELEAMWNSQEFIQLPPLD